MKSSNFICTVGPSNNSTERIERMIYKGMSVARLNFSHGTQEQHLETIRNLRLATERCLDRTKFHWPLAIAADLRGPEIRIGKIENSGKLVEDGDLIKFNSNPVFAEKSSSEMIYIDHPLADYIKKQNHIFIDNGSVQLTVEDIFGDIITCRVEKQGVLASNQSVLIPEIEKRLNLPVVSERDKSDLKFAVQHDIDFIFASHVESSNGIDEIRDLLSDYGTKKIKVYAKIQNQTGVDEIDEIISNADGIILSPTIELKSETIPFIQRKVLMLCKKKMKPCLIKIDSEMASSKIFQAASWYMDLGDGTILTRGASEGKTLPLESMTILKDIKEIISDEPLELVSDVPVVRPDIIIESLASACVTSSSTTTASAIIIITESPEIVRLVYYFRPNCEIIVVMENPKSCRQLNILDRVTPLIFEISRKQLKLDFAINFSKSRGILKCGDTIVVLQHASSSVQVHYVPYDD